MKPWKQIRAAMIAGHKLPKAELADQVLVSGNRKILSRAAWITGMGSGVKTATIYPDNPAHAGLPTIHGSMVVFHEADGTVRGTLDSDEITNLKTATDSVLGAELLARKGARNLLIIGSGKVAEHLVEAYAALMPHLGQVRLWNRTRAKGEALVSRLQARGYGVELADDLETAVCAAHVISSATMIAEPILHGDWVQPGTHVDLIGAFDKTMREADDRLIQRASLFCDSRETTIAHIGDFTQPIADGLISAADIRADFYDLIAGNGGRASEGEITLFKNGGGAHLDLMTAQVVLGAKE